MDYQREIDQLRFCASRAAGLRYQRTGKRNGTRARRWERNAYDNYHLEELAKRQPQIDRLIRKARKVGVEVS